MEADILSPELLSADEVFLTNSIIEIMPVTVINDRTIAGGAPGIITRKMMQLYKDTVDDETLG
jgi:branched-subunit amino acid aminotransferase/4-amino-4-deoxychorismate lyase